VRSNRSSLAWRAGVGRVLGPGGMLSISDFPAGRAPLGPGPVHLEGPQCPEGTAGGRVGGTPQRTEEMSHVEGEVSSEWLEPC
jgi:hypothetical protein